MGVAAEPEVEAAANREGPSSPSCPAIGHAKPEALGADPRSTRKTAPLLVASTIGRIGGCRQTHSSTRAVRRLPVGLRREGCDGSRIGSCEAMVKRW
jgi:hypothetical protein